MWILVALLMPAMAGKNRRPTDEQCRVTAVAQVEEQRTKAVKAAIDQHHTRQAAALAELKGSALACLAVPDAVPSVCLRDVQAFVAAESGLTVLLAAGEFRESTQCGAVTVAVAELSLPVGEEVVRAARAIGRDGPISRPVDVAEMAHGQRAELAHQKRLESLQQLKSLLAAGGQEPTAAAELRLRLGALYLEEGRYQLAKGQDGAPWFSKSVEIINIVIDGYPRFARVDSAWMYLAEASVLLGNQDRAVQSWASLVKRYPASVYLPEAFSRIGDHYFAQNNSYKALIAYKKASRYTEAPGFLYAQYRLAWCYQRVGEVTKAAAIMREVAASTDRRPEAVEVRRAAMLDLIRW